ncbi:MAG: knotted carbamoyltransferase YgeW, partial [Myxococcota bacterium]
GDKDGLKELERECLATNAKFSDWTCDSELMSRTKDASALYMHCLPADITGVSCEKGEVTEEVFEKYRVAQYQEAGYKPYIIAAMILTSRFEDPAGLLRKLFERGERRTFSK